MSATAAAALADPSQFSALNFGFFGDAAVPDGGEGGDGEVGLLGGGVGEGDMNGLFEPLESLVDPVEDKAGSGDRSVGNNSGESGSVSRGSLQGGKDDQVEPVWSMGGADAIVYKLQTAPPPHLGGLTFAGGVKAQQAPGGFLVGPGGSLFANPIGGGVIDPRSVLMNSNSSFGSNSAGSSAAATPIL